MQDGQKPDGPTETPGEALRRIVAAAAGQGLAPLDILRRLHAALGEVPPAGPAVVADATGRSRAEIRLLVSARTELRTPAAGASRDMARPWYDRITGRVSTKAAVSL